MIVAAQPLQGSKEGEEQTSVLCCSQMRSEQLQSCLRIARDGDKTTHIVRENLEELQKNSLRSLPYGYAKGKRQMIA